MATHSLKFETLINAGLQSLNRRQPDAARQSFMQASAANPNEPSVFFMLAVSCFQTKDDTAALQAVNEAIRLAPDYFQALLLRAEISAAMGNERAAAGFYMAAIKAAPDPASLPPDLKTGLTRAQKYCDESSARFLKAVEQKVGDLSSAESSRFKESIDILLGTHQRHMQQPRYYFFPGMPQRPFYDNKDFAWLTSLEAVTDAIRAELIPLLQEKNLFKPYVEGNENRPHRSQDGLLNNPDWSAFYLWKNGERINENAARCPQTMRAIDRIPLVQNAQRSPSVLFSLLKPGAHIPAHCGLVNTRLIGHLPLIVPGKCTFRVGNETRH